KQGRVTMGGIAPGKLLLTPGPAHTARSSVMMKTCAIAYFSTAKPASARLSRMAGPAMPSRWRVRKHPARPADQLHLDEAPAFVVPDILRIAALDLVVMSFQGAGSEA